MNVNKHSPKLHNIFKEMTFGEENGDTSLSKAWLKERQTLYCWIDGRYKRDDTHCPISSICEYEGIEVHIVDGKHFVEAAITNSTTAQKPWENERHEVRSNILYKISKGLQSKADLLLELNDQNIHRDETLKLIDCFNFYSDVQTHELGGWTSTGVVLIILSYESPLWVLGINIAAALCAGCSVVVKPSLPSIFSCFLLAEIASQSGLPNGLLNIVPGSEDTIDKMLLSDIKKVVYSGTYTMAYHLYLKSPDKQFSFLDTNHTASVILDTCDLQGTVDKLFSEIWNFDKQNQWSIELMVVHETIYLNFLEKFMAKINLHLFQGEGSLQLKRKGFWYKVLILKIIQESKRMGVKIRESAEYEKVLGRPLIVEAQSSDFIDTETSVFTLLTARNNKEVVNLINNFSYCLATSIWTENLSEALEVSSQFESSIIWVNCHAIMDAAVPFEPLRKSGNSYYGGAEGALDFMEWQGNELIYKGIEDLEEGREILDLASLSKTVQTSHSSFSKWKSEKNRKGYMKKISHALSDIQELSEHSHLVNFWAHAGNSYTIQKCVTGQDLYVEQNKSPIGVILLILTKSNDTIASFISLVSPAIALGNSVIVLLSEDILDSLKKTIKCFTDNLPRGILTVMNGPYIYRLASDPDVKALWLLETEFLRESWINDLREISLKCHKRLWIVSKIISTNRNIFWKQCLRGQAIWFSKINQCP